MKKRDNDFVEIVLGLADEHFSRNGDLAGLQSAIAQTWTEAESSALAAGAPFKRENVRWAVRRVLFQPNLWPDLNPDQSVVRRSALEGMLKICKG